MTTLRVRIRQSLAILKGLAVTFRYLFRPPVTVRYPEVKRAAVQPRFKGRHWLTLYADGMERCVGCELCVIVCPSQAIYVRAAENTPEHQVSKGERYAIDFQIMNCAASSAGSARRRVPPAPSCSGVSTSWRVSHGTPLSTRCPCSQNRIPGPRDGIPNGKYDPNHGMVVEVIIFVFAALGALAGVLGVVAGRLPVR